MTGLTGVLVVVVVVVVVVVAVGSNVATASVSCPWPGSTHWLVFTGHWSPDCDCEFFTVTHLRSQYRQEEGGIRYALGLIAIIEREER